MRVDVPVSINREERGIPMRADGLAVFELEPARYLIGVAPELNYHPWEQWVDLASGQTTRVRAELSPW